MKRFFYSVSFLLASLASMAQVTGPSSSQSPYCAPTFPGASYTSLFTVGDQVGTYRMVGIPDGMGAYDNGDGTFTILLNHELGNTNGIARAHGNAGAFVSKWIVNKATLTVISGADLIQEVYLWNGSTYTNHNSGNPMSTGFNRFCSADLPEQSAFFNSQSGKGTSEKIFMNGEEGGTEARGFAHIVSGPNAGKSYELPHLGKYSYENALASPYMQDKTIVIGLDDATPGEVYVYIGNKSNTGNEIEKAGLVGGTLYGVAVSGLSTEVSGSFIAPNTAFSLANLGLVHNMTGATLQTNSSALSVTKFLRPEDGAWDLRNPNDFYFVTTNAFNSPSRMYRLRFADITQPELGGTITAVLDGTEGTQMMDNIGMDYYGNIVIQEDPGGQAYLAKTWNYYVDSDVLTELASHDATRFVTGGANFLTQDEESSGIIDVQGILGAGYYVGCTQAHYNIAGELVQGGQMYVLYNPFTYNANPEISVTGNTINIVDGDNTPSATDYTVLGNVSLGANKTRSFVINNAGPGPLKVTGMNISGAQASDFSITSAHTYPFTIASGSSVTVDVRFLPTATGNRNATFTISNNDYDERTFDFAIAGFGNSQTTSVSSSESPYVIPTAPGVTTSAVLTVGDQIGAYRMVGIPDGLGAYDNGDATFTLLMNHELGTTQGIARAHGNTGAFVSKWIINKNTMQVLSGSDLIQTVYLWNGSTYLLYNASTPMPSGFGRFCSGDLADVNAFYNPNNGKGTQNRIYLTGEENGADGRAFGMLATGPDAGKAWELPYMGKFSWENAVASPKVQDKTIVVGLDDATGGQVYVYIGNKSTSGNDIQKAGLNGGALYGIVVSGLPTEVSGSFIAPNTPFTMVNMGTVHNITGATLETNSTAQNVTKWLRPEDGAWDPMNPNDFYFVTTNAFNSPSRMYRLRFTDINNPELGGTVTAVLDGTEGPQMMDNLDMDHFGNILIQEDPGNQTYLAKIWQYNVETDVITEIAAHDADRFTTTGLNFLTTDEECSGIIDMQGILGAGYFVMVVQDHYNISGELVQGGQLMTLFNPGTFHANPEISVAGNAVGISDGDNTPAIADHTDFGSVTVQTSFSRTYTIHNNGPGALKLTGASVSGANAADFTFAGLPVFPATIAAGSSVSFQVNFTPSAIGLRTATVTLLNNDYTESEFTYAIQGTGICSVPNATITPQGSTTFCPGSSVILDAPAASSYLWSNGATSQSISVSAQTNYFVVVTDANGCTATSAPVAVSVFSQPQVNISTTTGTLNVCSGSSLTLSANNAASFVWSTGATTQSVNVTTAGTFSVQITDNNGCTNSMSVTTTLVPSPNVTASVSATTICQGESVTFTGNGAQSYSWNNGVTNGLPFTPSATQTYIVTGSAANGCTDTDQVTVTVNPIPAIPVVTANGTTLTSSAATAYQWYLNGSTIGGQTGQSIVVTNNGTYMVVVTNASGCSNQSAPFAFNSVGVEEQSFINRIEFFPNPFSGNATIRLYAMESSQAVITLTDVTGKLVMNKTVTLVAGVNEIPMSEKEFAAENGNYFLTVEIGGKTQTIKAIKID
ncbi:MAG TPA: hypothetical protein DEP18_01910 [Flavobacteriales bacterium]|nr:hypothetical protein [Flavobacteriales bacterium]HRE74071.1 choice-of-anchor D domain-containing protein [Flavobacteriales bacterium]HRJ40030.1 choice-of-anchor D domain-containing protein [Flavobacteriales bacterium]